jgi:hypothetical protein
VHVPAWQVSAPLHTLPSLHDVPLSTGVLVHPDTGLQLSVVHTLPSLHASGVPEVHTPAWQVSLPLHTLPSLHDEPLGTAVFWQPAAGLQLSVVQTLPSLQLSGVPAVHTLLWQVSAPLHALLSLQDVPFSTGV